MGGVRRANITAMEFAYDPDDPQGFRSGMKRLGPLVGGEKVGASVYELPPGQALCPYHYEYGEEEWLVVLSGNPTVRHPEGSDVLEPWDVVCFPRGPDGAHGVRNETDKVVTVLMFSEVTYPTATAYPDSDKVGVWTGDKAEDVIVERRSGVGYWVGETPADD
jgi:uncharacterized cupin superfamily protein